jgi:hypothetical protein
MKTKKQSQQDHAKRRFAERLGVKFSQYIHDLLLSKLHHNDFVLVKKQSNRISVYEVSFTPRQQDMLLDEAKELTVHIVYDKLRKTIVTVGSPGTPFDDYSDL